MVYNLPRIRTIQDCEREFSNVIVISHYNTYDKFDDLYMKVYYAMCACYEIRECISYKIKFKFYDSDTKIYELSMPKFLLNINAWRPLIELYQLQKYYHYSLEIIDESFIVNRMMSDTLRIGLESKVLKTLDDYGIAFERSSDLLQTVIERYQEISIEFSLLAPAGIFTLENCFLNDYMNSEKIRELNNLIVPESMQTADVEELLKEKYNELVTELGTTKNPIWYISKAGNHVKAKQVQELFISYGQLPNADGNVIPYTMTGNGFSTGFNSPSSYYVAATGARLSAIMNKTEMGTAGYLARNLILLSRTMTLSNTMYDCGTKHMLEIFVSSPTMLRRLENKWYCEYLGDTLGCIHYETHQHLIGKKIYVRSLLTCAGGDEVCHVCYGRDSHLVANMPGMAIFNTEVYSEPVSQNILSTKHLLFTDANKLSFSNSFHKYFKFSSGDIYLKEQDEWDNELPFENLSLRIEDSNVLSVNEQDITEYSAFGNTIESPFFIYNKKTKEYDKIEIINAESMFIDATSMKLFKKVIDKKYADTTFYEITLDTLVSELEGRLMSVDIKNNGLTDNLYMIMDLLNKDGAKYDDYNQLAQYFFEMLINVGIRARNVQAEVILNRLIRSADNIYERPDFSKFKLPEYKILTLNQALLNTKAPTVAFSYQEIKRQLQSDDLYTTKDGSSYFDPLYSTTVDTSRLKELHKKLLEKKRKLNNE